MRKKLQTCLPSRSRRLRYLPQHRAPAPVLGDHAIPWRRDFLDPRPL